MQSQPKPPAEKRVTEGAPQLCSWVNRSINPACRDASLRDLSRPRRKTGLWGAVWETLFQHSLCKQMILTSEESKTHDRASQGNELFSFSPLLFFTWFITHALETSNLRWRCESGCWDVVCDQVYEAGSLIGILTCPHHSFVSPQKPKRGWALTAKDTGLCETS